MMYIYVFALAIVAAIAGILIAICSKRVEGVTYGKLDKAGIVTNIILIFVYIPVAAFCMVIASLFSAHYDGFLGVVGWIVAVIGATTTSFAVPGLGLSVALRRKGKSKLSFWIQFLGFAGYAVTILIFFLFYGNLLSPLN